MFKWKPIKELKPDLVSDIMRPSSEVAWSVAEDYMNRGYLPPLTVCQSLRAEGLREFTRRQQWVIAGALETLRYVAGDSAETRRKLIALRTEQMRRRKK